MAGVMILMDDRRHMPCRAMNWHRRSFCGKGNGLGLAVTRGIVDGAGGWIDMESGRGAGTAFHVTLPIRRR